jgi:hypothetical protein
VWKGSGGGSGAGTGQGKITMLAIVRIAQAPEHTQWTCQRTMTLCDTSRASVKAKKLVIVNKATGPLHSCTANRARHLVVYCSILIPEGSVVKKAHDSLE